MSLADGVTAHKAGRYDEAIRLYRGLLASAPGHAEARRLLGVALLQAGRAAEAVEQLERAVRSAPEDPDALSNLAVALRRTVRLGDAHVAARRAAALRPDDAALQFNLGNAAAEIGACDEAAAAYRASLALRPHHIGALIGLGHMLRALGDSDGAVRCYRACLDVEPCFGDAWWSIANVKTRRMSADEVERLQSALGRTDLAAGDRAPMLYARGKAREDSGDYEGAFACYSEGAALVRERAPFDATAHRRQVDQSIEWLDQSFFAARRNWGCADEAPIFIVGLPRSGSTLIEQILASHSDVESAGELPYMPELAGRIGPARIAALSGDQCAALGRRYLDLARAHRRGRPVMIDKLPNNFLHLGLIRLALPRARIVDARRHPLDSCLGAFKQYFAAGQSFSYDLGDLAAWYEDYHRLMRYWSAAGLTVIRVDYERLVRGPEEVIRSLADGLGLAWQSQMLDFHRTRRAVLSASADQVRRPLYQSSIHAWRRFAEQVRPLAERLQPLLQDASVPESGKAGDR